MQRDGFLHRYFLRNGEKRLHKWVHYFDIYERHLERFRDRSPVMLEIGVHGGGSVAMWKAYLGAGARIVGLDTNPACKQHESEGIEIFIGSQDDPKVIDAILARYPRIDIVLDDGSHMMRHMRASFDLLYHRVARDGVYVVEDLHTCYWEKFGGGLGKPETFIEFAKQKIDELNAVHTKGAVPVTRFTASTDAICIYDSIIVFERRPQGTRQSPITGPMSVPDDP